MKNIQEGGSNFQSSSYFSKSTLGYFEWRPGVRLAQEDVVITGTVQMPCENCFNFILAEHAVNHSIAPPIPGPVHSLDMDVGDKLIK